MPKDPGANDMITMGKRFLKNNNYPQALRMFEDAMIRNYNQSTTAAVYLVGLTYYQMGDMDNARQYFQILKEEFPQSRYVEEAQYHLALVDIRSKDESKQLAALANLYKLNDQVVDGDLSKEALNVAKDFIFYKASANTVKKFYDNNAAAMPSHKQEIFEAYCYRLVQEERKKEAQEALAIYVGKGGKNNEFLTNLTKEKKTYPKPPERNIIKIAMFLPLFVDNTNVSGLTEIPLKSQVALELFEGFQKAVEEHAATAKKQVYLKVYDTQRDNNIIGTQLADLETIYPDVIVGEVFNKQSRLLAEWAESKGITQVVPLSPTLGLSDNKPHVILARPSASTHGKRMATFAYNVMGLRKVAVWNDKKTVTLEMSNAFDKEFRSLGGQVVPITIDSLFIRSASQIPYSMNGVKAQGCDGMYVPISNEESVGLIFSYFGAGTNMKIMCSPDVESFYTIDREQKEKIGVFFTTSYLPDEGSPEYVGFYNSFLARYGTAPTESNLRGYDVGRYLLKSLDNYSKDKGDLSEYLKSQYLIDGIHIDFDFKGQPDNQAVHIMQYTRAGIAKRK